MRLFFVIGVVLLGSPAIAAAQGPEFGAKAGPGFATLRFDPDDGLPQARRIAADGGGFVVLPLAAPLALQLEGLFTSRGARADAPEDNGVTSTILLQYFDVPLLLRINGPRIGGQRIHAFAGPYVGIRIGAKRSLSMFVNGTTTGAKEDIGDQIERFDAGLAVGGGIALGRRVVVDGRYTRSLKRLNTDTTGGFGIWSRAITVMAGARF
jgi:hypothetical protein